MEADPGRCSQKTKNNKILTADSSRFSFAFLSFEGITTRKD